ncbi:hypothetical protein F5880DRAFT_1511596 [Lentinula raphanica]|nr:hypothetical protein F5880DRAFT_1511596 [Lentinula raphanica]
MQKVACNSTGSFNNAHDFKIQKATFNAGETINYTTNHNYHSNDKKEKEQILEWLAAPDCFTNLRTALNKRVTGTSQWILEDSAYKNWMEKAGIWWIQGKAGSGKTFLIFSFGSGFHKGDDPLLLAQDYNLKPGSST